MEYKLVSLRIPRGWTVNFNEFYEVSPEDFINNDYENRWEFKQGIYQAVQPDRRRILDLGWYPEFSCDGEYSLMLVEQFDEGQDVEVDPWMNPILRIDSRDIKVIIEQIEIVMKEVSEGKL